MSTVLRWRRPFGATDIPPIRFHGISTPTTNGEVYALSSIIIMGLGWVPGDREPYGGNALVGAAIGISVVLVLFVAARFWTRFMQRVKIGLDDYLILLALAASLAKCAIYIYLAKVVGVGYHITQVAQTPENLIFLRKCVFVLEILDYPLSVTPAKLALLLFYTRIFTFRKFRIGAYVVGSLVLGLGVAALFATFFQCQPLAFVWNRAIAGGKCVWRLQIYRILSPINVVTGLLIIILPIPAIWKLHAPRGQKLALTGVFLLGGLGTVASILSMAIFFAEKQVAMDDPTLGFSVELGILVVLESGIIIVAACLMSIWPLFTRMIPRRLQALCSRMPRENHHQHWYLRDNCANTKNDGRIERHREIRLIREEAWNSSQSSPCSLADLEDQRLSILVDDTVGTCGSDGKQFHTKSTL
ncbi:unnamed protein product [Penicillium salamii]|uniref:Rhodopsin domain-containing protein n=1 Tax=Penicillium salamii TaxID=1612424 RepID=A0A9W4IVD8_9EURO|nr:unnamed protein product [Penicillium salamii]CAG8046140.1 unnamed protein product [Penicillium salamii]CAG8336978.1 unnamed protein product [Penicillium salamii]CAG8337079.1 unnamed protein product [Penicillium salamii]CAG8345395.1 unnamed protein product [Penicillium salamii]